MQIMSSAFQDNGVIPIRYSCEGIDAYPPLAVRELPENSACWALIMDDPDASSGTFTHWVVWNIAIDAEIREGELPAGIVQGLNSFGKLGYGGPCPPEPDRSHRYQFTAYALDTLLDLPQGAKKEDLTKAMEGHILQSATLVGIYESHRTS